MFRPLGSYNQAHPHASTNKMNNHCLFPDKKGDLLPKHSPRFLKWLFNAFRLDASDKLTLIVQRFCH